MTYTSKGGQTMPDWDRLSDEALEKMIWTTIRDRKRLTKLELQLKDIRARRNEEAKDEYQIIKEPKNPEWI